MSNDPIRHYATKVRKVPPFTMYIEELRLQKHLSVRAMAKIIGIDRETYARRVSSEDGFTEKDLLAAARHFELFVKVSGKEIVL